MEFADIKSVIKKIRAEIVEGQKAGGYPQRKRLLALGFVRGRQYVELERTTEAQNFCATGKRTYYENLSYYVGSYVFDIVGDASISPTVFRSAVFEWMKDHYEEKPQVASDEPEAAQ